MRLGLSNYSRHSLTHWNRNSIFLWLVGGFFAEFYGLFPTYGYRIWALGVMKGALTMAVMAKQLVRAQTT
jgi:hypothetical protein